MKYYSEILDKVFDSAEELDAEEAKVKAEVSEKEALKKQIFAKLDEAMNILYECVDMTEDLENMLSTKERTVFIII